MFSLLLLWGGLLLLFLLCLAGYGALEVYLRRSEPLGSVWEFRRGGLWKRGRMKWKEWRILGEEGFGGFIFLH